MTKRLRIFADDLRQVRSIGKGILLGIIQDDGFVRLVVADSINRPGHVEWINRDGIGGVHRGFSLLVKDRVVTRLFPLSRLNPTIDARLEDELIRQLEDLFPLAAEYEVLGS